MFVPPFLFQWHDSVFLTNLTFETGMKTQLPQLLLNQNGGIIYEGKVHGVPVSIRNKLLLLLLSRFSRVWLCATPWTAAHQAPPSLGFSRQGYWSGLPFPSPMHEKKWKWSRSVVSDSSRPHGLQPTRLLRPWDFPGKSTGVGCHCLLQGAS